MRRQKNDLLTSDLKELELTEKASDPTLKISASLRVNKRIEWQSVISKYTNSTFSISDFKAKLKKVFDKRKTANCDNSQFFFGYCDNSHFSIRRDIEAIQKV